MEHNQSLHLEGQSTLRNLSELSFQAKLQLKRSTLGATVWGYDNNFEMPTQ